MAFGLLLKVTHTGKAAESVHVSDVRDGIDLLGGAFGFRKSGPIYVPTPANGGIALLVYSGDVAVSFEAGGIRKFIDGGYLTAEFVAGTAFQGLLPTIQDEGVDLTNSPTVINFVGAGVTATAVGDVVTVNIPGGGGGANHAVLSNLAWTVSGHTGTINTLAAFDGAGAAVHISTTVNGDVTGTLPGPLSVTGFSFPGQAQGDVLYFDGANWAILPAGVVGQVLQTGGPGANPSWTSTPSNLDHSSLTNLGWNVSGHTGPAGGSGSFATFDGAGTATFLTGVTHGEIVYFNGADWVRLAPGVAGQRLQTNGAGSSPTWVAAGGGVTDHTALTNLLWTASGHTGTASTFAAFTAGGATTNLTTTASGDTSGVWPNLQVNDLTIAGEVQGSVLYYNGANWVQLSPGAVGQVLQTGGPGANPSWTSSPSNLDHSSLTNLGWNVSGHTGAAGSLALFDGVGAAGVLTGVSHGDIIYFNGTTWTRLAPGTSGQVLQTQGAGSPPQWAAAGAGGDHSTLSNLLWSSSGHTGTANTFAAFNGAGSAVNLTTAAGGDTSGTWPTLQVNDLTIAGEVQGSILYFNGANWVQLPPGTNGQVLVTQGGGANPTWSGSPGAVNHASLTNLGWNVSGHTGTAGSFATFDGVGAASFLTGVSHGDIVYFNGTTWIRLAPGTAGQRLQTNGVGAAPTWVAAGGGATDHALLTNLGWTVSGHTGTAGSLATFNGAGAAALVTGAAHGDILYFNGTTWVLLAPGTVDGNVLTTQTAGSPPTWDNAIAVDTISESTTNNGVVINGTRHYPDSAADPAVGPAAADGDRYYNTTLDMEMRYDGTRAKWLSVESTTFTFGRNGNLAAGSYYRGTDGLAFSSTDGYPAYFDGTIVAFGYTRGDTDAATFQVTEGGTTRSSIPSAAATAVTTTLNDDFSSGGILGVRNAAGGNTTTDVLGWVRVRWRA